MMNLDRDSMVRIATRYGLDQDSMVRIATRYGLGSPGIASQWKGGDFLHPSGPDLGPKHLSIQWLPGLSRG
jgi:hypothetical protein